MGKDLTMGTEDPFAESEVDEDGASPTKRKKKRGKKKKKNTGKRSGGEEEEEKVDLELADVDEGDEKEKEEEAVQTLATTSGPVVSAEAEAEVQSAQKDDDLRAAEIRSKFARVRSRVRALRALAGPSPSGKGAALVDTFDAAATALVDAFETAVPRTTPTAPVPVPVPVAAREENGAIAVQDLEDMEEAELHEF